MSTFGAIVIAVLSTIGLVSIIQMVYDTLFMPLRPQNGEYIYAVIKASGKMEDIQVLTKALLRIGERSRIKVIIADDGMESEARAIADRLCRCNENVELTPIDRLGGLINDDAASGVAAPN